MCAKRVLVRVFLIWVASFLTRDRIFDRMRVDQCFRLSETSRLDGSVTTFGRIPSSHLSRGDETQPLVPLFSSFLFFFFSKVSVLVLVFAFIVVISFVRRQKRLVVFSSSSSSLFRVHKGVDAARQSARTNVSSFPGLFGRDVFCAPQSNKKTKTNSRPAKKRRVCVIYICATLSLFLSSSSETDRFLCVGARIYRARPS